MQPLHSRALTGLALLMAFSGAAIPAASVENTTAQSGPSQSSAALDPAWSDDSRLTAQFWIRRLTNPDRLLLDRPAIVAQNARLLRLDHSMHDLRALPAMLVRAQVVHWIQARSQRPHVPLFDAQTAPVPDTTLDALIDALDLDAIADEVPVRFGLVVQRASLRSFPTALRVFANPDDTDIDRFQESALFPGTPVAIVHRSRNRRWLFVLSPRYAAWIERRFVAEGSRTQVLDYAEKKPYRIVTGAKLHTTFVPGNSTVSELQLDMGVRVPLAELGQEQTVDGQNIYGSWPVQLPVRNDDGSLGFMPALLSKNADTANAPLPLTQANILRQAFKFLGERYGWGHAYNGRDCSGFVSEVYRSMGIVLPRNTGDQAISPALAHTVFDDTDGSGKREAAVAALQAGDLIYIPGHVMLMIGRIDGVPWVIHDIQDGQVLDNGGFDRTGLAGVARDDVGLRSLHLNAVAVTPLPPMMFDADHRFIDRITSIVHLDASTPGTTQ